jgi:hypothetical protein
MANITVKAANGTTDVVFTAMNPSAGDTVPALWRADAEGTTAASKPSVTLVSRWNGQKTARRVEMHYVHPYSVTDSTTGMTVVKDRIPVHISAPVPLAIPDTVIAEAFARAFNLAVATLIRDSFKSGFAPT